MSLGQGLFHLFLWKRTSQAIKLFKCRFSLHLWLLQGPTSAPVVLWKRFRVLYTSGNYTLYLFLILMFLICFKKPWKVRKNASPEKTYIGILFSLYWINAVYFLSFFSWRIIALHNFVGFSAKHQHEFYFLSFKA